MATVTLIHPPGLFSPNTPTVMSIPPIGLAYVAAMLEKHKHDVQIVDAFANRSENYYPYEIEHVDFWIRGSSLEDTANDVNADTQIVGITCLFMHHWPVVREIARLVRERLPNVLIMLGGEHVTGCPEYSLNDSCADLIVCGEGEMIAVEVANAIHNGTPIDDVPGIAYRKGDDIVINPRAARMGQVDDIPPPAWHLFPVQTYIDQKMFHGPSLGVSMPIMATRGCPYQCTFCTSPQMWTTKWSARNPKDVADEMQLYIDTYGADDFQFVDLTAILKRQWILDFCAEVQSRDWPELTWQLPSGTRSEAIDDEVSRALYQAGVRIVSYAPESGSPKVLKRIKKKVKLENMVKSIQSARGAGLRVECFMIMGFPDETFGELMETYRFLGKLASLGLESVALSAYRPVPGTEISQDLLDRGVLEYNDIVFLDLMKSTSLFGGISYNPNWSDFQLSSARFLGYFWFFAVAYTRRPWKFFRMITNVIKGHQTTKLEKALIEMRQNKKKVAKVRKLIEANA